VVEIQMLIDFRCNGFLIKLVEAIIPTSEIRELFHISAGMNYGGKKRPFLRYNILGGLIAFLGPYKSKMSTYNRHIFSQKSY